MTLKDKLPQGGSGKGRVSEGSHPARIVQIIKLGTQEDEYKGEKKINRQLWITYEVPEETLTVDGEEKPRWISHRVNELGGEKAKLTTIITAAEAHGSVEDYSDLLGKPVTLAVGTTSGGNAKVTSISAVPKSFAKAIPELANASAFWDIDEPDMEFYAGLPDFLKEMIQAAPEFGGESNPFK